MFNKDDDLKLEFSDVIDTLTGKDHEIKHDNHDRARSSTKKTNMALAAGVLLGPVVPLALGTLAATTVFGARGLDAVTRATDEVFGTNVGTNSFQGLMSGMKKLDAGMDKFGATLGGLKKSAGADEGSTINQDGIQDRNQDGIQDDNHDGIKIKLSDHVLSLIHI